MCIARFRWARSRELGIGLQLVLLVGSVMGWPSTAQAEPGTPPSPEAQESLLTRALGGLHWGMDTNAVLQHVSEQTRARYKPLIRQASDILEEDRLYQRMQTELQRIRDRHIAFDGTVTGWDVSFIGDEFRHGSQESMLVVQEETSRSFYFFISNRLWKWIKVFDAESLQGESFDAFGEAVGQRFGPGVAREGAPVAGAKPQRWLQWQDVATRLRAVAMGAQYCLVFESNRVLDQLAVLRKNAIQRGQTRNSVLEAVVLDVHSRDYATDDPHDAVADTVVELLRRAQE